MNVLETLRHQIDETVSAAKDVVASGTAKNHEDYVRQTTRIRTLLEVRALIRDVERRIEEN